MSLPPEPDQPPTPPPKPPARTELFPSLWQALGLLLAVQLGAGILYGISQKLAPGSITLQVLAVDLAMVIAVAVGLRANRTALPELFAPEPAALPLSQPLWLALLLAYPAWVVFDLGVVNQVSALFPKSDFDKIFADLMSDPVGVISVCLTGPVLEELLFRGLVLRSFLRRFPQGQAIALSALLFGLMHGNFAQLVPAMFMGVSVGWVYAQTRSLWPCIVLHLVHNGFIVYLSEAFGDDDTDNWDLPLAFWPGLLVLTYLAYRQWRKVLAQRSAP